MLDSEQRTEFAGRASNESASRPEITQVSRRDPPTTPGGSKTVAAGANCAIRRNVFTEIGGFCERLGPGTPARVGETVEIVDRVLRAGYRARYTPDAWAHHNHQAQVDQLLAKLRGYARGDSELAVHIARVRSRR